MANLGNSSRTGDASASRADGGRAGWASFYRGLAMVRGAALPACAIVIVGFFGGYALFGDNGVIAWNEYRQQLAARKAVLAQLEQQKTALANRVSLLDPQRANPDLVDELVRKQLGVTHPDEVIVPMR